MDLIHGFLLFASGLIILYLLFIIFRENKIDNDINTEKNKNKIFYGRYMKK